MRSRLRSALFQAAREAPPIAVRGQIAGDDGRKRPVTLHVSRLRDNLAVVVFREKIGPGFREGAPPLDAGRLEETAILQLESELSLTRRELQGSIEQLKSLNEELQSSNEELQAANEELETSREELQSLNEELVTVNAQLQGKIEEQDETNNDLNNFLASTNIPTIFLDRHFRIRRFTPAMSRLVKLLPGDVGRSIHDLAREGFGPDLTANARTVLDRLVPERMELAIDDVWYLRSVLPYLTADNRIEGVVVTYSDVTELKRAEEHARHLASFPKLNPNPVLEVAISGEISFSNLGAQGVLADLGLDKGDLSAFVPPDFDEVVSALRRESTRPLQREVAIKDRVFVEAIYLAPAFNTVRIYALEITERVRAEQALRESQTRLSRAQEIAHLGSWELDLQKNELTWSDEVYRIFGIPPQEFRATYDAFLERVHPEDRAAVDAAYSGSVREGLDSYEIEHRVVRKDTGTIRWVQERCQHVRDAAGGVLRSLGMVLDITERKRAEFEREVGAEFLQLVNESTDIDDLIRKSATFFQKQSGCAAVGIRLRQGDDYPYYEAQGFSEKFVEMENPLCARDAAGHPVLDSVGNPVLSCMCGNVIRGRFDAAKPFFTPGGSFWTNSTTLLLATTTDADRRARTRNRCNGEGYESVALVALRVGSERLGLLQFNDRRKGMFSPETIAFWERLAGYLAVAVAKFRAEATVRESETRYRTLFESMTEGFSLNEIICDESGKPFDLRYLTVNPAFERQMGMKATDLIGRTKRELFPDAEPIWFERYGRVALSGEPVHFEEWFGSLGRCFAVSAFRADSGRFAVIYTDVTERKLGEARIARLTSLYAVLSQVNEAIVRIRDEHTLYGEVCRIVAEQGGFPLVWIGEVEEGRVMPVASFGPATDYLNQIQIEVDGPLGRGPTGTAVREGHPVVNDDFTVSPALSHWREPALRHGFRASAAFPLRRNGEPIGVLTLYAGESGAFDAEQVRLLEALSNDLSYALDAVQQDRLRAEAEQDLRCTAEDLARSNQELEQFANVSSHDLQEPLRMVSAYAGLLRDRYLGQLDEKADQYLTFVLEGAQRMRLLINDLLAYSRVSGGASQMAPVNAQEPLEAALAGLRVTIDEAGARITQDPMPTVTSDSLLLAQIFQNLIGNAIKFRKSLEPPEIHVGARRVDPDVGSAAPEVRTEPSVNDPGWIFSVRDNGIGFDPQFSEKIFEIFQRLHSRVQYAGTGIGLAICRKIVERHGGRLWVESELGKGSTFFFMIPDAQPAMPGTVAAAAEVCP